MLPESMDENCSDRVSLFKPQAEGIVRRAMNNYCNFRATCQSLRWNGVYRIIIRAFGDIKNNSTAYYSYETVDSFVV